MTRVRSRLPLPSTDLGLVYVLVPVTALALLAVDAPRPVEWVLGVPFLLLYPGFALTSLLFPAAPESERQEAGEGPDWVSRLAVSFGLSTVVVATTGVLLSTTVGLRLRTVVAAVAGVTLAASGLASVRRLSRPPERRANALAAVRSWSAGSSGGATVPNVALAVAVLVLVAAVAAAGTVPGDGEAFTEFYLLAEGEDGSLDGTGFPSTFVVGEGQPVHVAVENHEGRPMDYEVVVLAQLVRRDGSVASQEEVDRFGLRVAAGERRVVERTIAPGLWEEGVRIRFLLYEGTAPADPDVQTADLALHRWVDVVEA